MYRQTRHLRLTALLLSLALLVAGPAWADYPRQVTGGVEFVIQDDNAFQVHLAGDFNDWSTSVTPLTKDEAGNWRVVLPLGPGEVMYKYVVDGNWINDPDNSQTRGEFGNSFIQVRADGSVAEAGGGRTPTALNSKLFLGGFYYVTYISEAIEREGDRVMLEKPTHDLNLAFEVALNPSLHGEVEMNINSTTEGTEMWRTQLNLQRARLQLTRPGFELDLFENIATFQSDDLLGLVGQAGTYDYDYGYSARGALFSSTLPLGLDIDLMLADMSIDNPWRPADISPDTVLVEKTELRAALNAGYRDDLVLQLQRPLLGFELGYLAWASRGRKPSVLYQQTYDPADSVIRATNYRTVQDNLLQAVTIESGWRDWLQAGVELVWGGADLQSKDRTHYLRGLGEPAILDATYREEGSWDLQDTRGSGIHLALTGRGLELALRHRYQENLDHFEYLYEPYLTDQPVPAMRSTARSYALDLDWERNGWRYGLGLEQEEFEFDDRHGWGDHFWFEDGEVGAGNLWQLGDDLPLLKYGLVGYRSASTIRQKLEMPLMRKSGSGGELDLTLSHGIASTRLDRSPLYWEFEMEWRWRLDPQWSLLYDMRQAAYDHDFLGIDDRFTDHFAELSYHLGSSATISLGYGVDPYWLDPISKEMLPQGRREYLAEQGADEEALRSNYSRLGTTLRRAEDSLSELQRYSLEARFEF